MVSLYIFSFSFMKSRTGENQRQNDTKTHFMQCSGHENAFDCESRGTILKKVVSVNDQEVKAYQQLMADERMKYFVPKFYKTVLKPSLDPPNNMEVFIEIEDLIHKFTNLNRVISKTSFNPKDVHIDQVPFIMDIKMGTRTFLESETTSVKLRSDLYEKMIKIDPLEATVEENENKSVTKLRYMKFRESLSSSSNLGFRIEGIQPKLKEMLNKEYQLLKEENEISRVLDFFLQSSEALKMKLKSRLLELKDNFTKSEFFQRHEVIGSSLLIIHDGVSDINVWMIDFAKTVPLDSDTVINHESEWIPGNREDGYLFGLNNLLRIIDNL